MIKRLAARVLAATMAVWAAWSLGLLARDLSQADALARTLEEAIAETKTALDTLSRDSDDAAQWARQAGYIHRGDIVFFDGG